MLWYTREASVAVYVANLPGIWPLAREHIRFLREHTNSYITGASNKVPKYGYGSQYGNMSTSKGPRSRIRTNADGDSDEIELGLGHLYAASAEKMKHDDGRTAQFGATVESGRPSEHSDERQLTEGMGGWGIVQVDTKVEIQRENWRPADAEGPHVQINIQGPGEKK